MRSLGELCFDLRWIPGQSINILSPLSTDKFHAYFILAGLYQVEAANDEDKDTDSKTCSTRLPRRRDHGLLSRIMDSFDDNILCP
jgi:hypothetical protein